jgi:outer membrane protein assembly factor BamB
LSLAVDDSRVLLSYGDECGESDVFLELATFNRYTGAPGWLKTFVEPQYPYSITVANGLVYVAETVNGVAAYRVTNGVERWRGLRGSGQTQLYLYDVAVAQGRVVVHGAQYDASTSRPVTMLIAFSR